MRRVHALPRRDAQRGLSLLELLVAAALGLVVVGTVLIAYMGSLTSARQVHALTRMTEDAQMALGLIARDIRMAGYAIPSGVNALGKLTSGLGSGFRPVFGCETDFVAENAAFQAATCAASGASGPSVLEVNVVASNDTSALTGTTNAPADCLGNDITPNNPNQTVSMRYYLGAAASGNGLALKCASNALGTTSGQPVAGEPLIDNVEHLVVRYGLEDGANPQARVVRYARADEVDAASAWPLVMAVRLCLQMRSADPVLTASARGGTEVPNAFVDCQGQSQTVSDRYLHRAYQTTVVIRSQEGPQAWLVQQPPPSTPGTPGTASPSGSRVAPS